MELGNDLLMWFSFFFFSSDIYKCARHLTRWGDLLPDPEDRQRPVKNRSTLPKEVSSSQ